jgi:predicted PhzF superfamily epimerase YddE/YHI9
MGFDFVLVDVFTDRPFGGNQLAVFPDAAGMADATMQQLAREFNLAMRSPEPSGTYRLQIRQGVAMGRPSELEGTARKQDGQLTEVVVGGRATIIGHGTITIPAG